MRIILSDRRDQSTKQTEYSSAAVSIGSDSANLLQLPSTEIPAFLGILMPAHEDAQEIWSYIPVDPEGVVNINDRAVDGPTRLADGDVLTVDRFTLKVDILQLDDLAGFDPNEPHALQKIKQMPLPPGSETSRPEPDVRLRPGHVETLARFSAQLGRAPDFVQLIEVTLTTLLETLDARMAWMGIRRQTEGKLEFVGGLTPEGTTTVEPPQRETFEHRCLNRNQYIRVIKPEDRDAQSSLAVPIETSGGTLGWIYVDTHAGTRTLRGADMDFLTVLSAQVAAHLAGMIEAQTRLRVDLIDARMALLREIQARLDPALVPDWPELQIAAYAKHGTERGGDVYDLTKLPNGLAAVMIGSVRADMTQTALAISEARSMFRVAAFHADPPHIQMKELHWLLRNGKEPSEFHGAFAVLNPRTGAAEVCTAGDVGALVIDNTGEPRLWTNLSTPPAGQPSHPPFPRKSDRVAPGETIALFSAGTVSATSRRGTELGRNRLVETLSDGFGQPARTALDDLLTDLSGFFKDGHTPDDITILMLHRPVTEM